MKLRDDRLRRARADFRQTRECIRIPVCNCGSRLHEWSDQRAERLAVADSLDGREQFKERPVSLVRKANELWGDCVPLGQSLKIVQCVELDGLSNLPSNVGTSAAGTSTA